MPLATEGTGVIEGHLGIQSFVSSSISDDALVVQNSKCVGFEDLISARADKAEVHANNLQGLNKWSKPFQILTAQTRTNDPLAVINPDGVSLF
jgi:hypothetical protein